MARLDRVTRRKKQQELRRLTRLVMAAYVSDIRNKKVLIKDVEAAIYDANRLHELLELDGGDLSNTLEAIRESLKVGGQLNGTYDVNSEAATRWIAEKSAELVADISVQQREAIQAVVGAGRALGENPRTMALDLVGRIGASGRREGGVIGLNGPQGEAVSNALINLRSGDPEKMRKYLSNRRRDRRYDGIVKRAMAARKPVNREDLHRIIARYQDRLMKTRGDTVARTETIEAINSGGRQAIKQQLESGRIEGRVMKTWLHNVVGKESRDQHEAMNGEQIPIDEPWVLPDGTQMMFPTDTSLGAGADQIINCRCTETYEILPYE